MSALGQERVFEQLVATDSSHRLRKFSEARRGNREDRVDPVRKTRSVSEVFIVGTQPQGVDRLLSTLGSLPQPSRMLSLRWEAVRHRRILAFNPYESAVAHCKTFRQPASGVVHRATPSGLNRCLPLAKGGHPGSC